MRTIFVGIEYAGKTTLVKLLREYYQRRQQRVHEDDHFTIPDSTLSQESRALMAGFPNDVKERMQRMQVHYHVEVIKNYANTLISGWHLEEAVYSAFYGDDEDSLYYPKYAYTHQRLYETMVLEARLPDIVLIHVTASDETIAQRMKDDPHEFPVIREADIGELKSRFEEEIAKSLFTHKGRKIELDTTEKTAVESLDELLLKSEPLITAGEVAIRALPVPDGESEVVYENGVRKLKPT